jgi:hypothetical protein
MKAYQDEMEATQEKLFQSEKYAGHDTDWSGINESSNSGWLRKYVDHDIFHSAQTSSP